MALEADADKPLHYISRPALKNPAITKGQEWRFARIKRLPSVSNSLVDTLTIGVKMNFVLTMKEPYMAGSARLIVVLAENGDETARFRFKPRD